MISINVKNNKNFRENTHTFFKKVIFYCIQVLLIKRMNMNT